MQVRKERGKGMILDLSDFDIDELAEIYEHARILKFTQGPADWFDRKISMPFNASIPGAVTYDNTPLWREIVNRFGPEDPATDITIMGPAQMGKTFMVLFPIIAYTISQNPCNIMLLTGHSELTGDTVVELDKVIDQLGLRYLIKPNTQKLKNNKTGDTATKKEFSGFTFRAGSVTNHNLLRFYNAMIILVDDVDAAKKFEVGTGSTVELVKGRTKSYEGREKRGWISTPQIAGSSIIGSQFELSDQRYYYIPCPSCKDFIRLEYKVVDEHQHYGLTYKTDDFDRIIPTSVHYICPKCANGFTEKNKKQFLLDGHWKPSCVSKEPNHFGYAPNGLYASPGMTSWTTLLSKHKLCHPDGLPRIEDKFQTFINIDIGELYHPPKKEIKKGALANNERNYERGVVPDVISKMDGNGDIVMLSWTADINGTLNDARLDWEIRGWAESGAVYSINHGSIGSFVPHENKEAREKRHAAKEVWTYERKRPNSVWPKVDEILGATYPCMSGRKMKIYISGIDTGYLEDNVYNYIDNSNFNIVGLKGEKESALLRVGLDVPTFKVGKSRTNLFLVQVNLVKNDVAELLSLKWNRGDEAQPFGYMNFPQGYSQKHFYSHFEAEERVDDVKNGTVVGFKWQKKSPTAQNHQFDCCIYQYALRDILLWQIFKKQGKVDKYSWVDFVNLIGR